MKGDTSVFFDKIDTVMGQADEVGDRYIQVGLCVYTCLGSELLENMSTMLCSLCVIREWGV